MNKFRKLGYIEYDGKMEIRNPLLNVVLYGKPEIRKRGTQIASLSREHQRTLSHPAGAGRLHGPER